MTQQYLVASIATLPRLPLKKGLIRDYHKNIARTLLAQFSSQEEIQIFAVLNSCCVTLEKRHASHRRDGWTLLCIITSNNYELIVYVKNCQGEGGS